MKCEEYFVLLCGHLDGMNNTEEEQKLQKHLETCEECRELLSQMKQNDAALRETQPIPSDLTEKIMQRVRKEPKQRKKAYWNVLTTGFAAAAVLAVVLLGGNALRAPHAEEKSMASPARCEEVATEASCITGGMPKIECFAAPKAMVTDEDNNWEPTTWYASKTTPDEYIVTEDSVLYSGGFATAKGTDAAENPSVLFVYASEVKELVGYIAQDSAKIALSKKAEEYYRSMAPENAKAYSVSFQLLQQLKETYRSEYFDGSTEKCFVYVIPTT